MSKQRRILLSVLSLLRGVMVLAVLGAAFVASLQRPATAEQSYPWCVQGETLQCYYPSREQCELTVNYHGFCVPNPNAQAQTQTHPLRQQRRNAR
jgi:hypothetical protein